MSSSSWRKSERVRRAGGERILFTNDDVGGVSSERRGREREEEEESHFFLWIEKNSNSLSPLLGVFLSCVVPLAICFSAFGCILLQFFPFCPLFLNKKFFGIHFKKRSARVSDTHPARLALVKTRRERVCVPVYTYTYNYYVVRSKSQIHIPEKFQKKKSQNEFR